MWKKSLIASNNATALSPSNGSWDEQSDCSLDSKPTDKELLASPQGQVTQSDNMDSAEGIWSADIEQAFIEAMAIYPPCGRRKIILSEEGKMYGRNELIARYIKLRTGKTRTRKQVSSHIQVLGRRHAKFISAAAFKFQTFRDHPYLSLNSPIKSRFTEKEIKACSSPEKGIISEERLPIKDGVVYHTPTKNFTSNECRGNNIMTPLKSSSAFNSATPREDLAPSEIHSLDDNNNNNNNSSKFTSENCSAQFYPDSTFSPSSHNNNGAMFPLQYNSPNFPPNEGTAYPYTQVQPYSGNSYCAPQDFRGHHRYRPETPTSCYPPMAHTYSPFTSQHQLWSSPGQYNRCMRTPDHATCNVSDHRRTPCMARDLTMGSSLKCIESPKLKLVEMSAFMESPTLNGQMRPNVHNFLHVDMSSYDNTEFETIDINKILDKFPSNKGGLMELFERGPKEGFYLIKFWTNLNVDLEATTDHFFASTTRFESRVFCSEIQSSSKVCSFGRQVVERIEKESCSCTENKFHFEFVRLPMCDYLVNFLHKLKQLPEKKMMNSVLENFTILQVVTSVETRETLLCLGFVFEVSENDADIQHCIYRLV